MSFENLKKNLSKITDSVWQTKCPRELEQTRVIYNKKIQVAFLLRWAYCSRPTLLFQSTALTSRPPSLELSPLRSANITCIGMSLDVTHVLITFILRRKKAKLYDSLARVDASISRNVDLEEVTKDGGWSIDGLGYTKYRTSIRRGWRKRWTSRVSGNARTRLSRDTVYIRFPSQNVSELAFALVRSVLKIPRGLSRYIYYFYIFVFKRKLARRRESDLH